MATGVTRKQMLEQVADEFMERGGYLPLGLAEKLPGCTDIRATNWMNEEIHFSATWPDITLVTKRSLKGYSLEGGLHRE